MVGTCETWLLNWRDPLTSADLRRYNDERRRRRTLSRGPAPPSSGRFTRGSEQMTDSENEAVYMTVSTEVCVGWDQMDRRRRQRRRCAARLGAKGRAGSTEDNAGQTSYVSLCWLFVVGVQWCGQSAKTKKNMTVCSHRNIRLQMCFFTG